MPKTTTAKQKPTRAKPGPKARFGDTRVRTFRINDAEYQILRDTLREIRKEKHPVS